MRIDFVKTVIQDLLDQDLLESTSSLLSVCAGRAECDLFAELGFRNVTISNLDERMDASQFEPFDWSFQDAENLSFDDRSFDWVFVADGLHHCSSPHRALLEMYRAARIGIIVIESRDSALMRLANRLGLSPNYELEAVIDHDFRYGGLNNTQIPNHIYRWTEAEFKKTLRSFDPTGKIDFRFFYGLNLPYDAAEFKKTSLKKTVIRIAEPLLRFITWFFKKQRNSFAMVALKPELPNDLWPWLTRSEDGIIFNRAYADKAFRQPEDS